MRWIMSYVVLSACLVPGADAQSPLDAAAWQADLRVLSEQLPLRHRNPFFSISRAQWDSAAAALQARIPSMTRNEIVVGLQRLVALVGDAHTSIYPALDPALALRYYPLELYHFEDGLFVRRADSARRDLVGARVLQIGRASTEDAMRAAASTISTENEWWVRADAPFRLMVPELLDGLGLVEDMERLPLVIERDGLVDTVIVAPGGRLHTGQHGPGGPVDQTGWIDMNQSDPPLYLQRPHQVYWWTYIEDRRTLYVNYRAVVSARDRPNAAFWNEIFAAADTQLIDRFVIDLRLNGGGNGFFNRHVIQQILRRPALDRPDVLYVILGRRTFSAAQQLANELDWWTQATFVGEPTGQRPSQYGDHQPLVLPNSGIQVQISTVYHQGPNPFDDRRFVPPAIYTPLTSEQYRNGIDPAMQAVMAPAGRPVLVEIEEAVGLGDMARAERLVAESQAAVANRFTSLEADINRLGYTLLGAGDADRAIAVFQLNARAYPESANVHDSLGEALASVGRRDEAIAAYRRALAIDPTYPPSIRGLELLGAR